MDKGGIFMREPGKKEGFEEVVEDREERKRTCLPLYIIFFGWGWGVLRKIGGG